MLLKQIVQFYDKTKVRQNYHFAEIKSLMNHFNV